MTFLSIKNYELSIGSNLINLDPTVGSEIQKTRPLVKETDYKTNQPKKDNQLSLLDLLLGQ